MADRFEARYAAGVVDEDPPEPVRPRIRAVPAEAWALRGTVLTPSRRLDDAYVEVHGDRIARVTAARPSGARIIDTDGGVILPGLIDLHGHPEYNVFAAWEPPRRYANRYAWRRSAEYGVVVKEPWSRLTEEPSLLRTLTRYAEARALVGGTTAIQGASAKYPSREEALVRNVDRRIFGEHRARSIIDLGRTDPHDAARLRGQVASGDVTAVYIHLAEGMPEDERSAREFTDLTDAGLLLPATIIIHGTALDRDRLVDVRDAGAKLVWSPQSNLRLYGATTDVATALQLGVRVGLGADWLPSGSPSLLLEMQVARRALAAQHVDIGARRLVQMVTGGAAEVAGLADQLGKLAGGRVADLVVLDRRATDPWESVLASGPPEVALVAVGGDVAYARSDWMGALLEEDALSSVESVVAWGRPMAVDTRYSLAAPDAPPPRLEQLRAELIARFPQVGPIWA
ncbi:MAG TPA: amidohydrolase family protein [Candidatus Angelobacter sp.]|nr:amidohydrolase family protein [Candidatus Angelobacter sp.]